MAFDPNFALYPTAPTRILGEALIGRFDGFPSVEHRLELGTTEHPIESGSTLTDHAVKRRERLRMHGWVSDILPAPGRELLHDAATDAWEAIVSLFNDRTPVTIITPLRVYRNMLIVRAVAPVNRRTGRSLQVQLDFAEVIFTSVDLNQIGPAATIIRDGDGNVIDSPAVGRTSLVDGGDRVAPIVPRPLERLEVSDATRAILSDAYGSAPIVQQVPLSDDDRQTFRTTLGGIGTRLSAAFNKLSDDIFLSVSELNRSPVVSGMRIVEDSVNRLDTIPLVGTNSRLGGFVVEGSGRVNRAAFQTTSRLLYIQSRAAAVGSFASQ